MLRQDESRPTSTVSRSQHNGLKLQQQIQRKYVLIRRIGLGKDHLQRYEFYHFVIPLRISKATWKAVSSLPYLPFILKRSMPSSCTIVFFGKAVALPVIFCLWGALGFCHLRSHWVLNQSPLTEAGYCEQKEISSRGSAGCSLKPKQIGLLPQREIVWSWAPHQFSAWSHEYPSVRYATYCKSQLVFSRGK